MSPNTTSPTPTVRNLASRFERKNHKAATNSTAAAASWANTPPSVVGSMRSRGLILGKNA